MDKEIAQIKKKGKLIALSPGWQYWVMDDAIYSVSSSGLNYNIWCSVSRLDSHLHRLYQVIGRKFFTEDPTMQIVDKDFISQFRFA